MRLIGGDNFWGNYAKWAFRGFAALGILAVFLLGGELVLFGIIIPLARLIG